MDTACTHRQLGHFLHLLSEKKVTPERFQTALSTGILADIFDSNAKLDNRSKVRGALGLGPYVEGDYEVMIDYSRTLAQMMAAAGVVSIIERSPDFIHKKEFEQFAIQVEGVTRSRLSFLYFDRTMKKDDVFRSIDERDCRPAKLEEMLALFEQHPAAWDEVDTEERAERLCALGTLVGKRSMFPVLQKLNDGGSTIIELAAGDFSHGGISGEVEWLLVAHKAS